jgi:hypothetical protein
MTDSNGGNGGLTSKIVRTVNSDGNVAIYRMAVGALLTICTSLSFFLLTITEQRLDRMGTMLVTHTAQISQVTTQEAIDHAATASQLAQIQDKLDQQGELITNLGIAVSRIRGDLHIDQ